MILKKYPTYQMIIPDDFIFLNDYDDTHIYPIHVCLYFPIEYNRNNQHFVYFSVQKAEDITSNNKLKILSKIKYYCPDIFILYMTERPYDDTSHYIRMWNIDTISSNYVNANCYLEKIQG